MTYKTRLADPQNRPNVAALAGARHHRDTASATLFVLLASGCSLAVMGCHAVGDLVLGLALAPATAWLEHQLRFRAILRTM